MSEANVGVLPHQPGAGLATEPGFGRKPLQVPAVRVLGQQGAIEGGFKAGLLAANPELHIGMAPNGELGPETNLQCANTTQRYVPHPEATEDRLRILLIFLALLLVFVCVENSRNLARTPWLGTRVGM